MANHWFLLILLVLSIYFSANIHTCFSALNNSAICSKHERLALLKFKHSVYDAFDMLSSWVGNDCCKWERVHCDKVTGKVDSLHLRGRKDDIINGDMISDEYLIGKEVITCLKDLRHLKFLDLSGNDFQGSRIPEFIGSFKQLSYLNLSNAFSGIIPPCIGNLSNLVLLDLKSDDMSWISGHSSLKSDDMSWISGLSSLKSLDLSYVNLSKAQNRDMVFYMMPSLVKLSLSGCGLTNADLEHDIPGIPGPFKLQFPAFFAKHDWFFSKAEFVKFSLLSLDLAYNMLNSSVPIMLNLRMLDLSGNNFKQIEDVGIWRQYSFGRMVNLRGLRLSSNGLTGPIPESLGRLRLLEELDLSHNQLTGPIPTFIGGLTQLDLSYNLLNGSIPESFGSLTALTYLDLSYNQLTGHVPTSLGRLVSLQLFRVYSNSLNGTVPVSIGQLTKLKYIDISENSMLKYLRTSSNSKLTFNVSREWKPPFQLMYADLGSNKIINGFPEWLRTQKKLRNLGLSNASITGPLLTWLWKIPLVNVLDLSHNKLSGPLTNLPNEGCLDFSYIN
ncbi:leucine-rich repeat protein [Tanacetum coccineum]